MWNKRTAQVIPVVVGSLGSASVTKNLDKWQELVRNILLLQKSGLLGTATILIN